MKASTKKRLEALEQAASMHEIHQLVILDVRTLTEDDRQAYRSGDERVLCRYGAPDRDKVPFGQIHTIVIEVSPHACGPSLNSADLPDEDIGK